MGQSLSSARTRMASGRAAELRSLACAAKTCQMTAMSKPRRGGISVASRPTVFPFCFSAARTRVCARTDIGNPLPKVASPRRRKTKEVDADNHSTAMPPLRGFRISRVAARLRDCHFPRLANSAILHSVVALALTMEHCRVADAGRRLRPLQVAAHFARRNCRPLRFPLAR